VYADGFNILGTRLHTIKKNREALVVGTVEISGKLVTNKNFITEQIKSRPKSRNACYRSVQNLLSSSLLSKNLKI
jgi:hypothetical protein